MSSICSMCMGRSHSTLPCTVLVCSAVQWCYYCTTMHLLQELHEGPWSQRDLDGGANTIIPIPAPVGGAVVVGENVVAYFNEDGPPKVTPIQPTIITVRRPCLSVHDYLHP